MSRLFLSMRFVTFGGLLALLTGCRLCDDSDDYGYAAYGGAWQRDDRIHGRVGSAFAPAGGPVHVQPSISPEPGFPAESSPADDETQPAEEVDPPKDPFDDGDLPKGDITITEPLLKPPPQTIQAPSPQPPTADGASIQPASFEQPLGNPLRGGAMDAPALGDSSPTENTNPLLAPLKLNPPANNTGT